MTLSRSGSLPVAIFLPTVRDLFACRLIVEKVVDNERLAAFVLIPRTFINERRCLFVSFTLDWRQRLDSNRRNDSVG
jgi:hypothetical protein